MKIKTATESLLALSQETRLAIFRLLVTAGPSGMNAGDLAKALNIPSTTFSFHIAHLVRAQLVLAQRESRNIFYSANFSAMDDLIAYLTENCCQGISIDNCLPKTQALNTTKKRRKSILQEK